MNAVLANVVMGTTIIILLLTGWRPKKKTKTMRERASQPSHDDIEVQPTKHIGCEVGSLSFYQWHTGDDDYVVDLYGGDGHRVNLRGSNWEISKLLWIIEEGGGNSIIDRVNVRGSTRKGKLTLTTSDRGYHYDKCNIVMTPEDREAVIAGLRLMLE